MLNRRRSITREMALGGNRNKELKWYQPENSRCRDGLLVNPLIQKDAANPSLSPHHIRLNLAVGVAAGAQSKTALPQRYEVDLARFYQRSGSFILSQPSGNIQFSIVE